MKRPKKIPPKLTARERKFFEGLAAGKTQKEAAIEAGYSEKYANQSAFQARKQIEEKAPGLFESVGLTGPGFIEKYIFPALNATETDVRLTGSGSKKRPYKWQVSPPRIAWGARTTTNRLVAEIMGLIVKEQETPNSGIKVLVINGAHRPKRPTINVTPPPGLGESKG